MKLKIQELDPTGVPIQEKELETSKEWSRGCLVINDQHAYYLRPDGSVKKTGISENIQVPKEDLQKLIDNFFRMCSAADELNIYEWEEMDENMQEMKEWTKEKFGRKLE